MRYKHTQIGWVVLMACVGMMIFFELLSRSPAREAFFPALALLSLSILTLLGTLTVEVDNITIRIRFGIGLVRKNFSLADVVSCRPVRNRWWWGWGIRLIPGGWLYNVSGLGAVELVMKNGKKFRIGTDEPQALNEFIQARLDRMI